MKKGIILSLFATVVLAGGLFYSCQKEVVTQTQDEGLMLKSASGLVSFEEPGCVDVPHTISFNYTGDKQAKVVYALAPVPASYDDWTTFYQDSKGGSYQDDIVFTETGVYHFAYQIANVTNGWASGGTLEVVDCAACEIRIETAFGGNDGVGVNEPGNWFYYFIATDGEAKIWAGQNEEIGTVTLSGGIINIVLNGDWKLKEGASEAVKVQGLNDVPTSRLQGNDYSSKGISLTVDAGAYPYYMIHLDVEICE
jgi:hypothetical protein